MSNALTTRKKEHFSTPQRNCPMVGVAEAINAWRQTDSSRGLPSLHVSPVGSQSRGLACGLCELGRKLVGKSAAIATPLGAKRTSSRGAQVFDKQFGSRAVTATCMCCDCCSSHCSSIACKLSLLVLLVQYRRPLFRPCPCAR